MYLAMARGGYATRPLSLSKKSARYLPLAPSAATNPLAALYSGFVGLPEINTPTNGGRAGV